MMTRRKLTLALGATLTSFASEKKTYGRIRFCRVPNGGLQPQVALDDKGGLHLVYYSGDAHHGDLFYARSKDGGASFSSALRVNESGTAIDTWMHFGGLAIANARVYVVDHSSQIYSFGLKSK